MTTRDSAPESSASPSAPPPVTLQTHVARAMVWNTAFLPIRTIVSFAANVIIVRMLTQDAFGVYVQVTALLATLGLYLDLGIERTIVRYIPEVEQSFGKRGLWHFFVVLMGVKLLVILPVIIFLLTQQSLVANYFAWGDLTLPISVMISLLLIFGAFSDVLYQYLIAFFRLDGRNALDVFTTIIQSILVVVLVIRGGVEGALLALTIATILNVIVGAWLVYRAVRQHNILPNFSISWRNLYSRFIKFSALSYVMNLSTYFYDLPFVILVLTFFNDTAAIAIFGLAFGRVVMPALRVMFTPLNGIQMPMFARLHVENNPAKLQDAYWTLSRFLCIWLIPIAVALAVLAGPLIVLFFQSRYADAASTASVLALFLFAESVFSPAQIVLMVSGRYRAVLISRIIALASIPLLFAAIPLWGAFGAAVAIGIGRVSAQLLSTIIASRSYHIHFPYGFFTRISLISLAMGAVMAIPLYLIGSATPLDNILKLALSSVLGTIVFVLLFRMFAHLDDRDKQRILTLPIPFKQTVVNWL